MKAAHFADIISKSSAFLAVFSIVITAFSFIQFRGFSDSSSLIFLALFASAYAAIIALWVSRMRERRLRQRRIFIIYSRKDKEKAAEIVQHLRSEGYNPWFDIDEIAAGQMWSKSVMKGIGESAVALYLVSENQKTGSKFVAEELKAAMSSMRSRDETFSPVIPLRFDDSEIPPELADVQWVDMRTEHGLAQLAMGLERVLDKV